MPKRAETAAAREKRLRREFVERWGGSSWTAPVARELVRYRRAVLEAAAERAQTRPTDTLTPQNVDDLIVACEREAPMRRALGTERDILMADIYVAWGKSLRKLRDERAAHAATKADLAEAVIALDESVALQSHQAKLLNVYDGGERRAFENGAAWIERLRECGRFARVAEKGEGK